MSRVRGGSGKGPREFFESPTDGSGPSIASNGKVETEGSSAVGTDEYVSDIEIQKNLVKAEGGRAEGFFWSQLGESAKEPGLQGKSRASFGEQFQKLKVAAGQGKLQLSELEALQIEALKLLGSQGRDPEKRIEELKSIREFYRLAEGLAGSLAKEGKELGFDAAKSRREAERTLGLLRPKSPRLAAQVSLELGHYAGVAKSLQAWQEQVVGGSKLTPRERMNQLGEMLQMGLKAREQLRPEAQAELSSLLHGVAGSLKELSGELKVAGAAEALEVLLQGAIDHDDRRLRESLSAIGLEKYVQSRDQVEKEFKEAKKLGGSAKREALLKALGEYALLRDRKRVEETVEEIRLSLPLEGGEREGLRVVTAMAKALKGSDLPVAEEVLELGRSLAEAWVGSEGLGVEGKARGYVQAMEFYQAWGDGESLSGRREEFRSIREELLKDLSGLQVSDRWERRKLAAQLDRGLLPLLEPSAELGPSRLKELDSWREEIRGSQDLSAADQIGQYAELAQAWQSLGALSLGDTPESRAFQSFRSDLIRDLDGLLEKLGSEVSKQPGLETALASMARALQAYHYLEGQGLGSADIAEKFRALRAKIQPLLHCAAQASVKTIHPELTPGQLEAELELHLFDLVAEAVASGNAEALQGIDGDYLRVYSGKLAEAHRQLGQLPKLKGQKLFEKSIQAAQAFAELGVKEKVRASLASLEAVAGSPTVPPETRVELLWVLSQIYGSAAMPKESRAAREAIVALGGRSEAVKLAQGLNALEDGKSEAAEKLLSSLPGNETAEALLKRLQWGAKLPQKRREAQWLAYLEASMLEFVQTKAAGGDAGSEASVKAFVKELGQLLETGVASNLTQALDRLKTSPKFSEVYGIFFVSGGDAAMATAMQEVLKASNPLLSNREFSGLMLEASRRMLEHGNFAAAGKLAQMLAGDPAVGRGAQQILEKIPEAAFWSAMGTELRNASILFATDMEAAVESFAFTAAGFGAGKIAAAGFRAGSALVVARRMKTAIQAGEAVGKAARLSKAAKAAAVGIEVGAMAAEAAGVTLANIHLHAWASGSKADYSHFGKEFASMMVLFGMGRIAHGAVAKLGGGKVSQYFTGVGTFVATKYVDPLLGLKPPTEDPFWKVVIQSFVEDAGMKAGGWAAHRIPGIKGLELGAHRRMIDSQLLPKLMELGHLKDGQLSEGGTLIYHAVLGRMAKGGRPELTKLKAWTPELLREGVEALKDLPGDAKAKEGLLIAHWLGKKGNLKKPDPKKLAKELSDLRFAAEAAISGLFPEQKKSDPNQDALSRQLFDAAIQRGWGLSHLLELARSGKDIRKTLIQSGELIGGEGAEGARAQQLLFSMAIRNAEQPGKILGAIQKAADRLSEALVQELLPNRDRPRRSHIGNHWLLKPLWTCMGLGGPGGAEGGSGARSVYSLGNLLKDVRALLIAEGLPEARVSLREVQRIKAYLEKFSAEMGAEKALASALWLTLGASFAKEQRGGELVQRLIGLLGELKIPGISQEKFRARLQEVLGASAPEIDRTQNGEWNLWKMAAREDGTFSRFNEVEFFQYRILEAGGDSEANICSLIEDIGAAKLDPFKKRNLLASLATLEGVGSRAIEDLIRVSQDSFGDESHVSHRVFVLGAIAGNPNIEHRQFSQALDGMMKSQPQAYAGAMLNGFLAAAMNPKLDGFRFLALLDFLKRMSINDSQKLDALSKLGANPALNAEQRVKVLVEGESIPVGKHLFYRDLARNPSLNPAEIEAFIQKLENSPAETDVKALAWGFIAAHPRLDPARSRELLGKILETQGDPHVLSRALEEIAQSPHLIESDLEKVIQAYQELSFDITSKTSGMGLLSLNPKLSVEQLSRLVEYVMASHAGPSCRVIALSFIVHHPKLSDADLSRILGKIRSSGADPEFLATALREISKNPSMKMETRNEILNELQRLSVAEFLAALEEIPNSGKAYRQELHRRFQSLLVKARDLKRETIDSVARISRAKGDETDIEFHLGVLKKGLGGELGKDKDASPVTLDIVPDFDPTLVTAHQLLDRLTQALTINRFVLLSGPPASGKSEVGRYLGKVLDWETVVFNANRGTSQEDLMQKVGVVSNGTTKFTITDGPLADALIHGKLFLFNEINLAKPGNLAFLFSLLADVNQSFDYYNAETGKTERRKIHPNFRMVGTQNPEGPGRKDLNAALKNRAIEIAAPAYSDIELTALIRGRNPEFSTESGKEVPGTLVRFYQDMAAKMESRAIGAEGEGYVWNLRHLMRLADGFKGLTEPTPQQILQVMYEKVGVGLNPKDREVFFDAVRNYKYKGVAVSEAEVAKFQVAQEKVSLSEVYREFGIKEETAQALAQKHRIVDIPTSARYLRSILGAIKEGYHPWLKGPAGTGKTKLAAFAAELLGSEVYEDTLTPQTDESQLKGELKPTVIQLGDGTKKLGFKQVPSALVRALRDTSLKPVTCILDEAAFARPDVLEELNSLLDRDGGIWVQNEKGQAEFLERPKNFRLILASNTYGYAGVNLQSEALRSRTHEIYMDFEFSAGEISAIFGEARVEEPLSKEYRDSLGQVLIEARRLFVEHGYPEARVSLREVQRIKAYVEVFGPKDGLAKATAKALWLTLGTSLPKEQRNGEIGKRLQEILAQVAFPNGVKSVFEASLQRVKSAGENPFEPKQGGLKNILNVALAGSGYETLDGKNGIELLMALDPEIAMDLFEEAAGDPDRRGRERHILLFGKIVPTMNLEGDPGFRRRILAYLQRGLEDVSSTVQVNAMRLYAMIAQKYRITPDKKTLNILFELCEHRIEGVRLDAANALREMSNLLEPNARKACFEKAIGTLSAFSTLSAFIQKDAMSHLVHSLARELPSEEEREPLVELILDTVERLMGGPYRIEAVQFLGGIGQLLKGQSLERAQSMLEGALKMNDASLIDEAMYSLARLAPRITGEALSNAIVEISRLCRSDSEIVKLAAVQALERIGTANNISGESVELKQVIEQMKSSLDDHDAYVRLRAVEGLVKLADKISREEFEEIYGQFIRLSKDKDSAVRRGAAFALGKVGLGLDGEALETAFAVLRSLSSDRNLSVKNVAVAMYLKLSIVKDAAHLNEAKASFQSLFNVRDSQEKWKAIGSLNGIPANELDSGALETLREVLLALSQDRSSGFGKSSDAIEVLGAKIPFFSPESREQTRQLLMQYCDETGWAGSFYALRALGELSAHLEGAALIESISKIITFCNDKNEIKREDAYQILAKLASRRPEIRDYLRSDAAALFQKYHQLRNGAIDGVARVAVEGGGSDVLSNAQVLKRQLTKGRGEQGDESMVRLEVGVDFDPTLVTAHQLLDRLTQALTINRFVLLSGPPASGKSEVGRYLGKVLDWETVVFNANRGISQEDLMQKIGVVSNGTTKFTITDGPLADALIHGKLFLFNEINLAKPGNLAFLFSLLADVNQSFDYYNAETGKTERRKIHPNFRMVGTQNPEGPGRKDLNAALKSRAIEIAAPAYSDIELTALIRGRNPEFSTEAGKEIPGTLVRFYQDMAAKMESRAIGAEGEGYVWNLRHLMRLADGFKGLTEPTPQQILQVMYEKVGVGLNPKDREVFFDAVRNYKYRGVAISEAEVAKFKAAQEKVSLSEVYREFGIKEEAAQALAQKHGIVDIPTSARYLRSILGAMKEGYHPWLKGPAGTGKTKLAAFAAELLGSEVYEDTLTPQTDESQLKGELKPTVIQLSDGTKKLGFKQVPSALVRALRDTSLKPVTCILDEAAFARPDVLEELNSLLDRDGGIWVQNEKGQAEFLERPKNFRLILASNTYGYAGVNLQSEALRSRTHEIYMDFEYKAEELDKLLGQPSGRPSAPPSSAAGPKAPVSPRSSLSPASPSTSPSIVAAKSKGAVRGVFGFTPKRSLPSKSLNTFDNPVRDKVRQAGLEGKLPEETVRELESRFGALKNRLLGAAASMGRTGKIALELDFNTPTASMELNEPRVFRVGPDFLLNRSVEDLLTVAQHEGGHADITRIGSGYFFQSEKLRSLLNVVEDLRVNARAMDRAPGREEPYLGFLKEYYYESYKKLSTDQVPDLLPHEAFLQAVMSKVYGGESPWDAHELVGPALNKALPHIEEAMRSRPMEPNPEETEVQAHFGRFEKVLKEKILPIYESLYQESLKRVEKRLEQEAQSGTAEKEKPGSGQGAGTGTIDPRDLSEKARKLLEDRAKKIADAHAPKGTRGEQQEKARHIHGQENKPESAEGKPEDAGEKKMGGSDRLEDFLDGRHQDYRRQQKELSGKEYSKALSELGRLPDQVFQVFDQLLKPNTDFEYEGHFTSGPKIDVARAIKAIEGLTTRLNVFKRKTEPTAKDYRFSLLLDASGSMADNGPRQRGGLGLAAMFADVFERLELPYSLDAFHDSYVPIKGFEKRLRTSAERNGLFNQMVLDTWGGGGTNLRQGLAGSLKRILEEQRKDKRDREFLFVLTDGEETHLEGPEVRTLCEEAAKRGVIVVGIGIGEGMDSVRKNFPVYLTEKNPERLPQLMAEFIKEYVKGQVEEG